MADAVKDNWLLGQLIIVPHVWCDDSFWISTQAEALDETRAALQAMYATLLQQPLSPQLAKLVGETEAHLEDTRDDH